MRKSTRAELCNNRKVAMKVKPGSEQNLVLILQQASVRDFSSRSFAGDNLQQSECNAHEVSMSWKSFGKQSEIQPNHLDPWCVTRMDRVHELTVEVKLQRTVCARTNHTHTHTHTHIRHISPRVIIIMALNIKCLYLLLCRAFLQVGPSKKGRTQETDPHSPLRSMP